MTQCTHGQVPPNGPQGFLNDYTLFSSGDLTTKTSEQNDSEPTCEQCEGKGQVVSYCSTCSNHLCDGCLQAHKTMKLLRNHVIVSRADHQTSEQVGPSSPQQKTYYCTIHPEESLKLFCKSCQSLVCVLCFVSSHNGHDIGNIDSNTRKEVEQTIKDLAKEAESKLTEFEANLQYIGAVEKDKVASITPIKVEINSSFDELITRLEIQRATLLQEVDDYSNNDLKELWAQKEYHETAIASLKGALSFAKRSIACEQVTELLSLCSQANNRLRELNRLNCDSKSAEKAEMTNTKFSNKGVRTLDVTTIGKIRRTTSKPVLEVFCYDLPTDAQAGQEVSFQVGTTMKIEQRDMLKTTHKSGEVQVSRVVLDGFRVEDSAIVSRNPDGESWRVTFTPAYGGAYTVNLQVKNMFGEKCLHNDSICFINVTGEPRKRGYSSVYSIY